MRGSIDYMAPEMLRQPAPGYDCRADSWSTGIILVEMLIPENAYIMRRSFPECKLPAVRWGQIRADGRLSDDSTDFLQMLLVQDPFQ
ncbi:hypothetical protein C8R47DRAFT_1218703 [Mycena vitilis]|nr:hypothetical protein C8R47DRAFT_1218703 [Mycena vitilis]